MAKRLEDQLTEARAVLEARRAEHAAAEAAAKPALDKAQAKYSAANAEHERLSAEKTATEHRVAEGLKLRIYSPLSWNSWKWHPELLKRIAAEVGVHWNSREKVDPKNTNQRLYDAALWAIYTKSMKSNPIFIAAKKAEGEARDKASNARYACDIITRPINELRYKAHRLEREVQELENRIKQREYDKQAAATALAEAKTSPDQLAKEQETAKIARDKLRAIIKKHGGHL